jgi:hypothetical protein
MATQSPVRRAGFDSWKAAVDAHLFALIGMDSDSLPDQAYHRWWREGLSSLRAAKRAIHRCKTQDF